MIWGLLKTLLWFLSYLGSRVPVALHWKETGSCSNFTSWARACMVVSMLEREREREREREGGREKGVVDIWIY